MENSSDGEWSENLNLVLERNSENESETPRSKRRCKLDVQIKYKLVKMNQKRLTLVDEVNEKKRIFLKKNVNFNFLFFLQV